MRATATVVGLATCLALTAGPAYASAPDVMSGDNGASRAFLASAPSAGEAQVTSDRARRCIGKKKVRRARVFVTYKRLDHILGKKGKYWAGTYRVWDVCYSSYDLAAYVQKKKGELRVYDIDAPLKRSGGRVATSVTDDGSRRCISKRTVKRKLRPYMTYRKVRKVLGRSGTGTPTSHAWKGCFGALKLGFDRVHGKRRVDGIDVLSAA